MHKKTVFISAFLIAAALQYAFWMHNGIFDSTRWGDEARYVETGDQREFNQNDAYGHPGGPLILGTIAAHHATGLPYTDALFLFLTVADAAVIAAICVLCLSLRQSMWWSVIVLVTLSINHLYAYATPPSALASLLAVLLSLLTLRLLEAKDSAGIWPFIAWGVASGALVATRADIGIVLSGFSALAVLIARREKRIVFAALFSFATFCVFDPFMWFMPVRHLLDLWNKVDYHYAEIAMTLLPLHTVFEISLPVLIGAALAVTYLCFPKRLPTSVPRAHLYALLALTITLYGIFLTARYEAVRYFTPIIVIWETLLPLLFFPLIANADLAFFRTEHSRLRARQILMASVSLLLMLYELSLVAIQFS